MSLYLPLPNLQSSSDMANNQDSLLNGKLPGKKSQFPPQNQQSLVRGEAMLVRGDNQVNLAFIEGLPKLLDSSK